MADESTPLVAGRADDSVVVRFEQDYLCWRGLKSFLSFRWRAHDERVALPCWSGHWASALFFVWRIFLACSFITLVGVAAPIEDMADRPVHFLVTFSYGDSSKQFL
jgi:hypothetical protein